MSYRTPPDKQNEKNDKSCLTKDKEIITNNITRPDRQSENPRINTLSPSPATETEIAHDQILMSSNTKEVAEKLKLQLNQP